MLSAKYRASVEEVRAIPAPAFTDSWHPISHGQLLDTVNGLLESRGLKVWKEEFGLVGDNKERMFAVLDLWLPEGLYRPDLTMSIGLRNSIDKTLAAAAAIGNRVFVCDNLSFSGEVVFSRKHTETIEQELPVMIGEALDAFVGKYKKDTEYFEEWKKIELSIPQASDFVCQLAFSGALHQNGILEVRKNFIDPPYPEFKEKNVWSLFNALTYYTRNQRRGANPLDVAKESQSQFSMFKKEWPLPISLAA